MAALTQGSDQVNNRIGQAPGQIAANRGNQQLAHTFAAGTGHTEGAGESEGHDQAKQDFRQAGNRVEHGFGGGGWILAHAAKILKTV
jgi:hypothetical protein